MRRADQGVEPFAPAGKSDAPVRSATPEARARDGERGHPLDAGTAGRMGAALGHSFAAVRVHDDPAAHALTARESAAAVTVGSDIAFAPGAYRPGTTHGDALLAHELAHVQQQSGAAGGAALRGDDRALETDAHQAAIGAVAHLHGVTDLGVPRGATRRTGRSLQRCGGAASWAPAMPAGTQTLPPGSTPGMQTGERVDQVLRASSIVSTYVTPKMDRTGGCSGAPITATGHTVFHNRAEFTDAGLNYLSRVAAPGHEGACGRTNTQAEAQAQVAGGMDGFMDQGTLHMLSTGSPEVTLHESLHAFADGAFYDELGFEANEGATAYLTTEVLRETHQGAEPTSDSGYIAQQRAIRNVVSGRDGVGNAVLCDAYFNGNLSGLRAAMNRGTGNENRYDQWKGYMKQSPPDYTAANGLF